MPTVPLPLVGPDYADETASFGSEGTVNMIPEVSGSEGTRSRTILRSHAGLTALVTGLDGPVRGIREMGGILYVVAGQVLYSVDSGGVATNLGTILGGNRCVLTDSFIPNTRRQLVIMTSERAYVYNTLSGLAEITDEDFVSVAGFDTATTVDSYTIAETEDGFIYSNVSDATAWDALDFKTAEANPDGAVAVWSVYGDLWVFGQETIEVFRNTGDSDDPFQRAQTIEKGLGAKYSPANLDNGVFWIDNTGRVWRANGWNPVRVSDHSVEQYLASVDYSRAFGFTYVDRGHEFYCFTVPGGKTFLYDVATGLWHRRKSEDMNGWRANCQAICYGWNLFGDSETGTVWKLDSNVMTEGAARLIRERYTGCLHADGLPLFVHTVDLTVDTGNAALTGGQDETAPVIEMRYSDDRGRNWCGFKQRSLGSTGDYGKRVRWNQLGMTRQRVFHFRISDPVRCDLIAVSVNLTKGEQA